MVVDVALVACKLRMTKSRSRAPYVRHSAVEEVVNEWTKSKK